SARTRNAAHPHRSGADALAGAADPGRFRGRQRLVPRRHHRSGAERRGGPPRDDPAPPRAMNGAASDSEARPEKRRLGGLERLALVTALAALLVVAVKVTSRWGVWVVWDDAWMF